MIIVQNEVRNHSKVDEGVMHSLATVSSGFVDARMHKIIQKGVHGNIIHLLSAIWLEDEEHVNLMRMRRDWVEFFRHLLEKKRMLMIVGWQKQTGPVSSIFRTENLGTFHRVDLKSSCNSSRVLA